MLTRLRRLLSGLSLPGWVVLAWVVLGEIHVATFAVEILREVNDYLQGHIFVGLIIGFGLLLLSVLWPDLKKQIPPWIGLPKTIHERVHEMEGAFANALHLQKQIDDGHEKIHDNFSQRISTLEDDRTTGIGERSALDRKIAALDERMKVSESYDEKFTQWIQAAQVHNSVVLDRLGAAETGLAEHTQKFGSLKVVCHASELLSESFRSY